MVNESNELKIRSLSSCNHYNTPPRHFGDDCNARASLLYPVVTFLDAYLPVEIWVFARVGNLVAQELFCGPLK